VTSLAAAFVLVLVLALEGRSSDAQKRPLCFGKRATIVGSARTDGILGTNGADVIVGLGGSDAISGLGGSDLMCGGSGNDKIDADDAGFVPNPGRADRADGGPGKDICREAERTVRCEETRPDLPRDGPLKAGTYVSETFRPRVGFTLGAGWSLPFVTLPTQLLLSQREDPGGLHLRFDSIRSRQSVAATIARFRGLEGVDAGSPVSARVGRAAGQYVDLTVTAGDGAFVPGLTEGYELEANDRVRVYAVSVKGATVTILVEAPARDFATFTGVSSRVLASVRWG
jgi:Ca2+-binding RTX toxin-like protein